MRREMASSRLADRTDRGTLRPLPSYGMRCQETTTLLTSGSSSPTLLGDADGTLSCFSGPDIYCWVTHLAGWCVSAIRCSYEHQEAGIVGRRELWAPRCAITAGTGKHEGSGARGDEGNVTRRRIVAVLTRPKNARVNRQAVSDRSRGGAHGKAGTYLLSSRRSPTPVSAPREYGGPAAVIKSRHRNGRRSNICGGLWDMLLLPSAAIHSKVIRNGSIRGLN